MAQEFPQQFDTAAIYPLEQITDAAQHLSKPGKVGTVLIKT
jgi:hypothetical protein